MKEAVQKDSGGNDGKEVAALVERKVGRLVGRGEEDPTKGAETCKDKQEIKNNLEEEDEYQEETSLEDKDGKKKCSVCKLGDQYSNTRIVTRRYMILVHSLQLHSSIILI